MMIDFGNKTLYADGVKSDLMFTLSGHYCILIGEKQGLINDAGLLSSFLLTSDSPHFRNDDISEDVWLVKD